MWEWLMDQSRYEVWPHIVATLIGLSLGRAIFRPVVDRIDYSRPWAKRLVRSLNVGFYAFWVAVIVAVFWEASIT